MSNNTIDDYQQLQYRLSIIFSLSLLGVIIIYSGLLLFSNQIFWRDFQRSINEHFPTDNSSQAVRDYGFYPQSTPWNNHALVAFWWRSDPNKSEQESVAMVVQANSLKFSRSSRQLLLAFNLLVWLIGSIVGFYFIGWLLMPAKKAYKEQRDFLANASHELKTPITTIKTELSYCRQAKLSASVKESLAVIEGENNYLANTVEKLLLNNDQRQIIVEEIELISLVKQLVTTMQKNYRQQHLKFKLIADKEIQLISDLSILKECLVLLLDNACKYADPNSQVILKIITQDKNLIIEVINQGIGIKKSDEKAIFQRFYRVADGRVSSQVGSGLGLAIARDFAKLLGGKLFLASGEPANTSFVLQLKRDLSKKFN